MFPNLVDKWMSFSFACVAGHWSDLLTSFLLSARSYGRRSGGVLCHALSRGADCAADGFRNQPGGESGPDQIPLDWPTVHLCIRPGQ